MCDDRWLQPSGRCPIAAPPPEIGSAVRDYLGPGEDEVENYGYYSYLLFTTAPIENLNEARYRVALDTFLGVTTGGEEKTPSAQLNLTYALVATEPPESVADVIATVPSRDPARGEAIEWLLRNYDYPRAKQLVGRFEKRLHAGPYLIQSRTPLSDGRAPTDTVIVQDLSDFSPELVGEIIRHVLKASREKRDWSSDELQVWLLHVRDIWHKLGVNTAKVSELITAIPIDTVLTAGWRGRETLARATPHSPPHPPAAA